jgi:hypothetical protein
MPVAGFEPTIPASEQPQIHAIDSADTSIGLNVTYGNIYIDMTHSSGAVPLKANSHLPCHAHAVPLPCRVVTGLDCVAPT